jgi:hypothetical protein
MPKGPRREKHPADVSGAAVTVAKIATGEHARDGGGITGKLWSVEDIVALVEASEVEAR